MTSIKMSDVARAAGVSIATVGRAIHNNGYVAADKKEEIERVIKELGYIPNKMAQGLKRSESRIIGHLTVFSKNMLYEQISRAIDVYASKEGYHVLTLSCHRGKNDEEKLINELLGQRVDGIIVTSNIFIKKELLIKLTDLKIPVVMIERTYELPFVDRVIVDDLRGSYEAVSHMIDRGHRNIAFIGTQMQHQVERDRYQGYHDALIKAGIEENIQWLCYMNEYSVEEGYRAGKKILKGTELPTAIFMTSDIFACGVMQYMYENEIKVPRDISLVGYDNTLSTLLAPPITSMALPHTKIGQEAIKLLIERIENRGVSAKTVEVSPILIDRNTVLRV